jgi:hypothetical protein
MATIEMEHIARHVKASAKAHGTRMRFLLSGPRAYRHRPAMYVEGHDRSTHRVVHMDQVAGPDGYRRDGVHARQISVSEAVEGGLPSAGMLAAIDTLIAWRAFEDRRTAMLAAMGVDEPDWSRTVHVMNLAAHGAEGVKRLITGKGDELTDTAGYIHGQTDIGINFNNILDHRTEIMVTGELPETVRMDLIGRPVQDLVDLASLKDCPPVPIVSIFAFGGPDGPRPSLMVRLADVRATLAPVPDGVDPAMLLPPGSTFA